VTLSTILWYIIEDLFYHFIFGKHFSGLQFYFLVAHHRIV
jgi:hypothetical protein